MKFIKYFESYDSFEQVKEDIDTIKSILQDIIDDYWLVSVNLVPKRWENPDANYHIKSDYIDVYIKKKQCKPGSRYFKDSEFFMKEVNDIDRILSIYKYNEIIIKICTSDLEYSDPNYLKGVWNEISVEEFKILDSNIKILGISMSIFLDTENIDKLSLSLTDNGYL